MIAWTERLRSGASSSRVRGMVAAAVALLLIMTVLTPNTARAADDDAAEPFAPVDPQNWVDMADLTWDDYTPIRPDAWDQDTTSQGTENQYKTAIILMDFPDQPFLISQEAEAHPFGNPQPGWEPVAPEDVDDWMYDYFAVPNQYNGGQTLHGYWMEDTHGKIGVEVEVFGPYTMPHNSWQYGLGEFGQNSLATNQCPAQSPIPTGGTDVTDLAVTTTDFFYVGDVVTIRHDMFPSGDGRPPLTITRSVVDIPNATTLTLDEPVEEIWDGARVHDCGRDVRTDGSAAWRADTGCPSGLCEFDNGFYVTAGHDESSTWQEFGEMLFEGPDDVPDALGNPNPNLPNWSVTRYVPWTSWKAAANHWPNAGGGTSTQAESSGQSVYAHEFSHLRSLPDNYNNPFADNIRNYSGYWEMMSRGTFNGPGGTHNRWQVPNQGGSGLGPHHTLRHKRALDVFDDGDLLELQRDELADQGIAVATVQQRSALPGSGGYLGIQVRFGETTANGQNLRTCAALGHTGDNSFWCHGNDNYHNYEVEVVDRVGNDSFIPGHGVLVGLTRNTNTQPNVWLIDPDDSDINMVDFYRPDGTPVMVVRGDPRQLNDATFHAGTDSDSEYEFVDDLNNLHFYVLDTYRDEDGVLLYDIGVRRLTGAGDFERGVELGDAERIGVDPFNSLFEVPLTNTGEAGDDVFDSDIFRISSEIEGDGWSTWQPHEVAAAAAGDTIPVQVYTSREEGADDVASLTVTATSEADPTKSFSVTVEVQSPEAALGSLYDAVEEIDPTDKQWKLRAFLNRIDREIDRGNWEAACTATEKYLHEVNRLANLRPERGPLPPEDADVLRGLTDNLLVALGC